MEMLKDIHTKAIPFISWLKNAAEESNEEEDDAENCVGLEVGDILYLFCLFLSDYLLYYLM